jgi:hypothetical protein
MLKGDILKQNIRRCKFSVLQKDQAAPIRFVARLVPIQFLVYNHGKSNPAIRRTW